jgi:hypothetical protein
MNLDEQLAELLASLGVTLEEPESAEEPALASYDEQRGIAQVEATQRRQVSSGTPATLAGGDADGVDDDALAPAELSLFQTSREHYGVFYRLDLVANAPQLHIFAPADEGAVKMRCYLVRPAIGTPVREWFLATRAHDGSAAYDDMRDTAEQHLLFAAGEALKRLFWAGEPDLLSFPEEIEVSRLV